MSIASEITRIQGAKADLKTAIEGKGVIVPSSTKLDGYADLVDDIQTGGGDPNLQDKSVSYTPTESEQTATITADSGYDGLDEVSVTVGAIDSDYVGSGITRRTSDDLTVVAFNVLAPKGYYESNAMKSVARVEQGIPVATKSGVSNHRVNVTPSVLNQTGWITVTPNVQNPTGTVYGESVTVSASELVSGTKSISANGTEDVTNYASVSVSVPNSYFASDEGKVVDNGALVSQTSATYTENGTYDTTLVDSIILNIPQGEIWMEETITTSGAVTKALDTHVLYHFTGALTSLTITLNAPASGEIAQYHFDFLSGSTAPTLTMPNTVTMPDSFAVKASKRYEVDILNNYGTVVTWAN